MCRNICWGLKYVTDFRKGSVSITCIHSSKTTALSKDGVNEESSRLDAVILLRNFSRSVKMYTVMGLIYLFFMWA